MEIWAQIHELDKVFLPENKVVRIAGLKSREENPLMKIESAQDIEGRFDYMFRANAFNTSRMALQTALSAVGQIYITPLSLQAGTIDATGIYRWQRDMGKAYGIDPDQYIKEPAPGAGMQRIFAEEAISLLLMGRMPVGEAAEGGGPEEHYAKLTEYVQSDEFGLMPEENVDLFKEYLQRVAMRAGEARRAMALADAAQQMQQGQGGGTGGRPPEQPPDQNAQANPPIAGAELLDESLPSERGGVGQ